ncbi:hypothetical protein [Xanthovirga aplysinae]|uniref:hypothetical protein n=1 Tax=Xanthovirga aplysinae TaxID=2529853 RepID=UPI0012BCD0FB|nr:hypothetical protein [Xanthovirga aplysinae]MTI29783.1 hypothetical protein [Xanthovirga aplysinae]
MNKKWSNHSGCLNILENLTTTDIHQIQHETELHTIQFYQFQTPNRETWDVLNQFFKLNPTIELRIKWYNPINLEFIQFLPNLRCINISSFLTKDFDQLTLNKELNHIGIEETKSKAVDISFLREFQSLKSLYVDGNKKGIEVVSELKQIAEIVLRGFKLSSINFLLSLPHLTKLKLLYGNCSDFKTIAQLKNLKSLEISRVRQIENYSFLEELTLLEFLTLEGQANLQELPNLKTLKHLKFLSLQNNKTFTDISKINKCNSIEVFWLSFSENQKVSEIKSLLKDALKYSLNSESIKYTNLTRFKWITDEEKIKISNKGIKDYREWIVHNSHKI